MPDERYFSYRLGHPSQLTEHIFSGTEVAYNSMNLYLDAWNGDQWSVEELLLLKMVDDFHQWFGDLPFESVATGEGESEIYYRFRKDYGDTHFNSFGFPQKYPYSRDDVSVWSWVVVVILTFARRRKLNPFEVHWLLSWMNHFEHNLVLEEYSVSSKPEYVVYEDIFDEDVGSSEFAGVTGFHGGGRYSPPGPGARFTWAGFKPEPGGANPKSGGDLNIEADFPIPVFRFFPKWSDDIIKRFHRSDDPEMKKYAKELDDWIVSMENVVKGG